MSALVRTLAILNGTVGDYLVRTDNALALPMEFIRDDAPLVIDRDALAKQFGDSNKVVVLIHGLMASEADWRFPNESSPEKNYGAMLERDFGFSPLFLRYNSGRSLAANGAQLSLHLDQLIEAWPVPVEELVLLGHSMGGLVARAACHSASLGESRWLAHVRRAIYLGTPHRGAPAEKLGRLVTRVLSSIDDPYTKLIAQIADLRSDGIKDMGDAALRAEDRKRPFDLADARHPVPLLPTISHLLVAGSIARDARLIQFFGDGMVPISSATDGVVASKVIPGMPHMTLAHDASVYAAIAEFIEETEA